MVERITFSNPESGYTVARLAPERSAERAGAAEDQLVTLVGTLPDLTPGEAIVARGWWRNDPKHGWQFTAIDYHVTLPATLQGMKKYLGSGLVKGVGPVNAARIVDTFGDATFEIIERAPERLTEVPGIGPVRAARIAAAWEEQRHIRDIMAALQSHGISTSLAVRIYKCFGNESVRVMTREPYRLAREVWGIGFKTADRIAQTVGIAPDAPARLEAGILYTLSSAAEEGHTLLAEESLAVEAARLLGVAPKRVTAQLETLRASGEIIAAERDDGAPLLALAPFARAEHGLAHRLRRLAAADPAGRAARVFGDVDWGAAFRWLAERHGITLSLQQEAAVRMALTQPVSILTGGPGTGKTHTLRALLALAGAKRLRCLLAAPTGRAAKRMEEATGWPAATLHRLLEIRPGGRAVRGPDDPLPADLVVVDEASMLDVLLANQLVRALEPGTHLLFVGDPDQLPSVGPGDVLADLLRAGCFPVTRLEQIFRQGAGSGIALNARRVNAGEMPRFGGEIRDSFFLPSDDPAAAAELVVDLVTRRLPARYGFRPTEVQVLAPMHRGPAGVAALNQQLQDRLNPWRPGAPEARAGSRAFRAGDRVLQLQNDYDLAIFNGDLGTIRTVDLDEQELVLLLDDGREVRYPFANLHALTHAYAISIHKAQGAEFPAVVIPLLMSHAPMLGRSLLYTALTRARELVVIVGQKKALYLAVRDWRRAVRSTALGSLLTGAARFRWPSPVSVGAPDETAVTPWAGGLGPDVER